MSSKKSLRQEMRALLSAQSPEERDRKSRLIQKKLFNTPAFQRAGTVCFYVSLPMEVNTYPMIVEALHLGKKVLAVQVDWVKKELKLKEIRHLKKDLAPGILGIPEPVAGIPEVALEEARCFIVPALAFDAGGHRLGRGGGFYDRLLARIKPEVPTIGLAFSFQQLPQIPLEDHDRIVQIVLTDKN